MYSNLTTSPAFCELQEKDMLLPHLCHFGSQRNAYRAQVNYHHL